MINSADVYGATFPGSANAHINFILSCFAILLSTPPGLDATSIIKHSFFNNQENVKDAEIKLVIDKAIDRENPCKWYYSLIDYGTALRKLKERFNAKFAFSG